jgi:hypothetical protein
MLWSFGISTKDVKLDLSSLYWITKLHKSPCKHHYIDEPSKWTTKHLSKLLTSIKIGLLDYCGTSYSRRGMNLKLILKNSKGLLDYM